MFVWRRMARIPLVVKDELAAKLDRGVALLTLKTGQRQTRTSFIVRAIETEVEGLECTAGPNRIPEAYAKGD